ncbi:hypothetical protein JS533_010685 [Bifidobacterium amazonense]|uniref:DUF2178 domain-containing protein n=1 Tax=Bifidobacterium amazonense TaxID=2809027 RepID=A0ABS9VX89_9BIFI|nr:hypothetical protein [Bifidobacterium amazonense]MCH9276732.1 hypothetical protein [Bifidobacterium amazonense]
MVIKNMRASGNGRTSMSMSAGRLRMFVAAGTIALYCIVLTVCACIRYGCGSERFWDFGMTAAMFLVGAILMMMGGIAYRGKVAERLEPDTHDRLLDDRSDAVAGRILFVVCVNLCVDMLAVAMVFQFVTLQYLALGLGTACVLYVVISIIVKTCFRGRLNKG